MSLHANYASTQERVLYLFPAPKPLSNSCCHWADAITPLAQSGVNYTMPMIYSATVAWVLHKTGNIKLFNKGSKKWKQLFHTVSGTSHQKFIWWCSHSCWQPTTGFVLHKIHSYGSQKKRNSWLENSVNSKTEFCLMSRLHSSVFWRA